MAAFTEADLLWSDEKFQSEYTPLKHANVDEPRRAKFPRLGRPVPVIRPEYDVVVVGSGYGGGVAASRMARAGKRVAVLELGKEKWPGEYPSALADVMPELHVSGNAATGLGRVKDVEIGKRTGLYHLVLGQGQNAFVGNGLGGTSLLNANVFLEADRRTLAMSEWPPELRNDPTSLDPYYKRAAEMLQPSPYPEDYPPLHKLSVLEKQAKALGKEQNFYRVPQTTFFHDGLNVAGVEMKASTGSGQDCTGVNDGSKNSVLMNYIPDAWNWGAEIFCECEVRYVCRDEEMGGYIIFFAWHGGERHKFEDEFYSELMWVRAKELCFLAAGALGTTEILLRSKARGMTMSKMVGQKMSGNGDIMSFGYNTDEVVNGVGQEHPKDNPPGPTITGIIDNRGPQTSPNVLDGYVIEEGCFPEALTPVLRAMLEFLPNKEAPGTSTTPMQSLRQLFSQTKTKLLGLHSEGSSLNRTQTYLVMSHDSNEAILSLENDKPYLQFLGVGRTQHAKRLNEVLAKATSAIGGKLVRSPMYSSSQPEEVTVHPLGGAAMRSDGTGRGGVTNHLGQVYSGEGSAVHEGLVCLDGSIVSVALGVNPFATITALAERSVHLIALDRKWTIDQTPNGRLDLFGSPKRSFPPTSDLAKTYKSIQLAAPSDGVRFTEILQGQVHIGDNISDFSVAESVSKGCSSAARLYLSVQIPSVEALTQSPNHSESLANGTFSCAALSKDPLLVLGGRVEFFSIDQTTSDARNLAYKLRLLSTNGEVFHLDGSKQLDSNMSWSIRKAWKATTTLYTTLTRTDGSLAGKGVIRVSWRNFKCEMRTLGSTTSDKGLLAGLMPTARFLGYFARSTADYFLGPLRSLEYSRKMSTDGYFPKAPPAEIAVLTAKDGVRTTLRVWKPRGEKPRGAKLPLLFVVGASTTHEVFATPTIDVNTVEYFNDRGYTVYVLLPRFGAVPSAELGYTPFEARLDVLAAAEFVRSRSEGRKMYVLAHCVGSIATASALLDGTLPASWLRGLTVSQVFLAQWVGAVNARAARIPSLTDLYTKLTGNPFYDINSSPSSPLIQQAIDQILRFYPVGSSAELCNSAACHRLDFVFSRLWVHANLTHSTHSHVGNFFGGIHMRLLSFLMAGARAAIEAQASPENKDPNVVLNDRGENMVTGEGVEGLRGLPIHLISGGENVVYTPEATNLAYDMLRNRFGTELYRRTVVPKYGHLDCWIGRKAHEDVYPHVAEHVRWCEERERD
ncbi:hypothetical protein JOL62DRAFT_498300 [Phyllosticta paracitricarpa]|uniref:FAD/NAD(P)-binding domain-containing protein n=1 Tax=Phyllosticta paracitricarpa TaxID=2016321 RepID=A0ABR1ND62_9PEZI